MKMESSRFDRRGEARTRKGAPGRIRTPNTWVRSPVLCPIELRARALCSRGQQSLTEGPKNQAPAQPMALSPVISSPTIKPWISCVPS